MNFLTENSVLMCPHGGKVQLKGCGMPLFKVDGQAVICLSGLNAAPIVGCVQIGPGLKPCTRIVSITEGFAPRMAINRSTPLLSSLQAISDGNPPGIIQCSAVQQMAKCLTSTPHHANAGGGSKSGKSQSSTQTSHKISLTIEPIKIASGAYELHWSGNKEQGDIVLLVLGNPTLEEDLASACRDTRRVLDITKYSTAGGLCCEDLDFLLSHILSLYRSHSSAMGMDLQCKAVLSKGGVVQVDTATEKGVTLKCPIRPLPTPINLSDACELKGIPYYDPVAKKDGRILTRVAATAEEFLWFKWNGEFETNPHMRGMDCTSFVLSMLAQEFRYYAPERTSVESNWALSKTLGGMAAEMRLVEFDNPVPLPGRAHPVNFQPTPTSEYIAIDGDGKSHPMPGSAIPVNVPLIDMPGWLLSALLEPSNSESSIKLINVMKQAQIGQYGASLNSGLFLVWISHHVTLLLDGWIQEFNVLATGQSGYFRTAAGHWFQRRPNNERFTVVRLPNEMAERLRHI